MEKTNWTLSKQVSGAVRGRSARAARYKTGSRWVCVSPRRCGLLCLRSQRSIRCSKTLTTPVRKTRPAARRPTTARNGQRMVVRSERRFAASPACVRGASHLHSPACLPTHATAYCCCFAAPARSRLDARPAAAAVAERRIKGAHARVRRSGAPFG